MAYVYSCTSREIGREMRDIYGVCMCIMFSLRKASFDRFYFHRTDNPDITQGDVIIHADLTVESEGKITELKNVRLRMEEEYDSVSNGLFIDKKIYTSYYGILELHREIVWKTDRAERAALEDGEPISLVSYSSKRC